MKKEREYDRTGLGTVILGRAKMPNYTISSLVTWTLVVVIGFLLAVPEAWAETYTSLNTHYPDEFYNSGGEHNDMRSMDAVYFGGREIYFFTMITTMNTDWSRYLYFYTNEGTDNSVDYYSKVDIENSSTLDFRIKLLATPDYLYVFYTPAKSASGYDTSTIYYRTVWVDHGTTGNEWRLVFSDKKSIAAGVSPVTIRMAQMLDETMHVIFSAGDTWYSIPATQGVQIGLPTFGSRSSLFTASGITGAGGTVFQIPNAADTNAVSVDMLMIAYATGSSPLHYYFFDGKTAAGPHSIDTPSLKPSSVRLIAGSAEGYTNSVYSIQVFFTHDQDKTWHNFYHREYIPAGANGAAGSWSSAWNELDHSDDDAVHCYPEHISDPCWAIIPTFTSVGTNVQMYLHLWYSRGTALRQITDMDAIDARCSSYLSDILVHQPTLRAGPDKQDMGTYLVLGVIEGTPPYPVNGGLPEEPPPWISAVDIGYSTNESIATDWTVGGSYMAYYSRGGEGQKLESGRSLKAKFGLAIKCTQTSETSGSWGIYSRLQNFALEPVGDCGFLVAIKPEIVNDPFILRAYDQHPLVYSGDTDTNEFTVSLITYGPATMVGFVDYYLTEPSRAYGTNTLAPHFVGMEPRPPSSDFTGWVEVGNEYQNWVNPPWAVTNLMTGDNPLDPTLDDICLNGVAGADTKTVWTYSKTSADTVNPAGSFTFTAEKLGMREKWNAGVQLSATLAFKSTTTSTMTGELGFSYTLPKCGEGGCIAGTWVKPKLLVPLNDNDDKGYNCPWISDDIRNNRKPKPWCLTYWSSVETTGNGHLQLSTSCTPPIGPLCLKFTGDAGSSYDIETSTDLRNWTRYSTLTLSNGTTTEISVGPATAGASRFYRAKRL